MTKTPGSASFLKLFLASLVGVLLATYVILPAYQDLTTPDEGDVFSSIVIDDPRSIVSGSDLNPVETADGFEVVGSVDLKVLWAKGWLVVLVGGGDVVAISWNHVTSSKKRE